MKRYRILVADDHPLARAAIRSLLEGDPSFELVGEAANGKEAFQQCGELNLDLILLDINMPVWDGMEATRQIKQYYPQIRIVILTVSDDVADLFTALQFGAQGYLLKNMESEHWISYLHSLILEDAEFSRRMAGKLFHHFRTRNTDDEIKPDILTRREREILKYVGQGFTNKQLAERLFITENTAKNHIKNILEKLFMKNRSQLAAYAVQYGLTM
ncbi:MAG: Transcriptional regulatory protein DegU [Pelotomaculum sp. PtaU1.Bin035]|nr:MAG: Transcriptional regulatory protein DegU [Pelotomaculum sp. PtaU1.Bin035]